MGLLSFSFSNESPKNQGLLANNVIQNMKTNALFVSLNPEVLILEEHYIPFWEAYNEALKGGTDRKTLRETLNIPMLKQLNKLGHLVEAFANGDTAIAQASGFDLKKTTKTSIKTLLPPTDITLSKVEGKLGWVEMFWKGAQGSKSYDIINREQGTTEWVNGKHTTKQSIIITDLPLGKYVEFCVSAKGTGEKASDNSSIVGIWIS